MKHILSIALTFLFYINVNAQSTNTVSLLEDQNPNFEKPREKYMKDAVELTKNEGQTIQQTYKAIDDVQAKKERKELASERRQERRLARIQSRGYRYNGYSNYGYGNYGYSNYGYNNYSNNGYNNYGYSPYGNYGGPYQNYGYNPFGYNGPRYLGGPTFGAINNTLNTALLGLTLWSILKH